MANECSLVELPSALQALTLRPYQAEIVRCLRLIRRTLEQWIGPDFDRNLSLQLDVLLDQEQRIEEGRP
jgi:hypothetical protein